MNNVFNKLFVVATPIGHLGDLSRRAEDVLKSVQIVAAEDTRRTKVLLDHIGHRAPQLLSVHEHNEAQITPALISQIQAGTSVALVSDAGTPLVNDPGYLLLRAALEAGIEVVPIPGPSAITAALSVCPLPCMPFRYVGFLPAKARPRKERLQALLVEPEAIVFFETPHRILACLAELEGLTDRRVMLGRELTKRHETILVGTASEVLHALGDNPKGEIVGIVEARGDSVASAATKDAKHVLAILLEELAPAQAARLAAQICGERKAAMYELAMSLRHE